MENMKFCQSCAMPMEGEQYGTNADGSLSADYCSYCYDKGTFRTEETMEDMIESCIPHVVEAKVYPTAEEARKSMMEFFPQLKRWAK